MKRALALLAPVALVCGLAACSGDDDDSPDATTATEETATEDTVADTVSDATVSDDTTDSDGTTAAGASTDMMGELFPNLSSEQLDCLVDEVGAVDPAQVATQAQEIAEQCDIDPADLTPDMSAISIPDLGDVSIPDNMDEIIKQVFPSLTDEQASCLAEQFGDDFDPSKAAQVAETCDIDPSDLAPG